MTSQLSFPVVVGEPSADLWGRDSVADLALDEPSEAHGRAAGGGSEPSASPAWSSRRRPAWPTMLTDFASLWVAVVVGLVALAHLSGAESDSSARLGTNIIDEAAFPFLAVATIGVYGLHRRRHFLPNSFGDLTKLTHAVAVGAFLSLGLGVILHRVAGRPELEAAQLTATAIAAVVTVLAGRAIARWLGHQVRGRVVRVLVVGSGMMVDRVRSYIADDPGVEIVGSVDDDPVPGDRVLGGIKDLVRLCEELHIDRVLIGFSRTHPSITLEELRPLQGKVPISVVPRYFELLSWRSQVDEISGLPVIDIAPPSLSSSARFAKRTVDVVNSLLGLIVLSPILAASALAIKLTSKGPVFFRQLRQGQDGRLFWIYKLRTMSVDAESARPDLDAANEMDGPLFKIREDPRVFPVGRFLRATSLDEIPQLFNVLRGDMSLVGPRPFIPEEAKQIDGWAARRFEVRPGLTGLWQVSGRNHLSFDDLRRLDYIYVASWSLWWDLRIAWHTPASVLRRRGAY